MMIFLRYGIVAGLAYGIDFGGFIFLLGLGYSPALANVSVKVIAAIFGFFHIAILLIRLRKGMTSESMRSDILA